MIKGIIFDMDGLMIDTEKYYFESEREIAKEYDTIVPEETLWKMMGRSPLNALTIFAEDLGIDTPPQELLDRRNIMMEKKMREDLPPLPGLFAIIEEFHDNKKLAIATGSQKAFLDITVETFDLQNKFEVLQSSDEVKHGKPNPEIYNLAIGKLGLKPEHCVVLEDSSNGALAGKKAGCYVISIPSPYTEGQDFSFVDYIAKDLFDARDHIKKL